MLVARLQAFITLAWLAAALAWPLAWRDRPLVALAGLLLIPLAHGGVLALEFALQRLFSGSDPTVRATGAQICRAWAGELLAAPRLFCWQQPFRSRRHPDQASPAHRGQRGVVFVHGYLCNRGAWNPWLQHLVREGSPFIALDLSAPFGRIEEGVPQIEAAVAQITQATGLAPVVVAHSMGGLALRAWMAQAGDPARVHRWVTLGSPHHGTWTAHFGHTPNARQLCPGSPWLRQLERAVPPAWHARAVCFFSNADNMVFPPQTATLPGADNRLLPGLAHVQMLMRPELIRAVLALRQAPELDSPIASPGMTLPTCQRL